MISTNKDTRTYTTKQALFSACNYREFIRSLIVHLSKANRAILNHIIKQYLFYGFDMRESQELIANSTGYTRQTVNSTIANLSKLDLIQTSSPHGQSFNFDTLNYVPNPLLFKYKLDIYRYLKSLTKVTFGHLQKLGLMGNLTPYKKIFISKPCKYMYQLLDAGKRGMSFTKNIKENKRVVMNEVGELIISPTLRNITESLKLTKLGQLKLLVFPDEVLSIVWKSCRTGKNIARPFDWMVVGCEQYCKANQKQVNWDIFYSLLKRYNIEDNKKYVRSCDDITPDCNVILKSSVPSDKKEPAWKLKFGHLDKPHRSYSSEYEKSELNRKLIA